MTFFYHRTANFSKLTLKGGGEIHPPLKSNISSIWKLYRKKDTNLLKEIRACRAANRSTSLHVELSCSNYGNMQFNNYFQLVVLSKVLCLNTWWGYHIPLFIHPSIHPSLTYYQRLHCLLDFIKFGIDVRKTSNKPEFHEIWLTDSHTLLKSVSAFFPVIPIYLTDLGEIWYRG